MAVRGSFPPRDGGGSFNETTPVLGQIVEFAGNFAPNGWLLANGQLLSISQNTALFSLLGTTYGGDGQTTFALPDLRGRPAVDFGQGPGLSDVALGQVWGAESLTLNDNQLAAHTHNFDALPEPGAAGLALAGVGAVLLRRTRREMGHR